MIPTGTTSPASSFLLISGIVILLRSICVAVWAELFALCVATAAASKSAANAISKPAWENPRSRPPAPQKKTNYLGPSTKKLIRSRLKTISHSYLARPSQRPIVHVGFFDDKWMDSSRHLVWVLYQMSLGCQQFEGDSTGAQAVLTGSHIKRSRKGVGVLIHERDNAFLHSPQCSDLAFPQH